MLNSGSIYFLEIIYIFLKIKKISINGQINDRYE